MLIDIALNMPQEEVDLPILWRRMMETSKRYNRMMLKIVYNWFHWKVSVDEQLKKNENIKKVGNTIVVTFRDGVSPNTVRDKDGGLEFKDVYLELEMTHSR